MVDVAKLTATVAQNAQPSTQNNLGQNSNNISPKKIYAKIKKLSLPKERDEFLAWYQKYLENTIFGNHHHHQLQGQHSSEKGKSTVKQTNQQQQQHQQQQQNDLQSPDDGDLAEADQNCSLNNSGGGSGAGGNSNNYNQAEENDTQTSIIIIKPEGIEYENNENPDEAHSINAENPLEPANANHVLTASNATAKTKTDISLEAATAALVLSAKPSEESMAASEKSDIKCEKPEFNEKE